MAGEVAKRQAMNLSELDVDNDQFIKNNKDFVKKIKLQDACLKTTFVEKPDGPQLWATSKPPVSAAGQIPKYHMQVTVVYISSTIPKGNTDGSDITDIPKETFLPRKFFQVLRICSTLIPTLINHTKGYTLPAPPMSMTMLIIGCMSHLTSETLFPHSLRSTKTLQNTKI